MYVRGELVRPTELMSAKAHSSPQSMYIAVIYKGFNMNHSILFLAVIVPLSMAACDRPAVVTIPAAPVAVPGPPGPQGEMGTKGATGNQGNEGTKGSTGNQGNEGSTGATGKPGDGTTVIVVPPTPIPVK